VTPNTGALVVQILQQALAESGLTHVIQLAQGDGSVGSLLVQQADLICMTGSTGTGRAILNAAHETTFKKVILELGGKDAMIIMADVAGKLRDRAVADAVHYSLYNAGQVCCAVQRIYIAQTIYDDLVFRLARQAEKHVVGAPLETVTKTTPAGKQYTELAYNSAVTVGPLVTAAQRNHVARLVANAVQTGARLVYQSTAPTHGSFYPVTVLADVNDSMDIYHTETFGPVVCCIPFDGTIASAIRLANDTAYGLSASVYSADTEQAAAVARQIRAGQVGINCNALENLHSSCPWVGHRNSGYGYHSGLEGFAQFSLPQTLVDIDAK
jgi:acyl-CoA reductase-like NAD-dependent aldehyde dehydrogenase